jgi:hypothetical protein
LQDPTLAKFMATTLTHIKREKNRNSPCITNLDSYIKQDNIVIQKYLKNSHLFDT